MPRTSSEVPSSSIPTQSEPGPGDGAFSLESSHGREPSGHDSFPGGYGDMIGDGEDDDLLPGDADAHEVGFRATSEDFGALDELGVELSPWAPLLGLLDATEPEEFPDDRPFTPAEGGEGPHALELRAESMLQYAARGAQRTGTLDRTEVGLSDDNRDIVAGRDEVEVDGMLDEHTGHGLVVLADDVEMNVGGSLAMHAHLEDNVIMGGGDDRRVVWRHRHHRGDERRHGGRAGASLHRAARRVGARARGHGGASGDVRRRRGPVRARRHALRARVRPERARGGGGAAPGHDRDDDEDGLSPADEGRARGAQPHPGRRRWRVQRERLASCRTPGSGGR